MPKEIQVEMSYTDFMYSLSKKEFKKKKKKKKESLVVRFLKYNQ